MKLVQVQKFENFFSNKSCTQRRLYEKIIINVFVTTMNYTFIIELATLFVLLRDFIIYATRPTLLFTNFQKSDF